MPWYDAVDLELTFDRPDVYNVPVCRPSSADKYFRRLHAAGRLGGARGPRRHRDGRSCTIFTRALHDREQARPRRPTVYFKSGLYYSTTSAS